MNDDFSIYANMQVAGSTPEQVYQQASRDGLDPITRIRLIRRVFSLSLGQAKEVVYRAEGVAQSLDEHQERIATNIEPHISQLTQR